MAEYIEREAAVAAIAHRPHVKGLANFEDGVCLGLEKAKKAIQDIPSVDVQPVRHGRWRLYSPLTDTYECDKCGYQVIDESFRTNYCPNCGAKMDGGEA